MNNGCLTNGIKKRLITIQELSQLIGLSVGTLYHWVSQKKIPYVKIGKLVKFDTKDVEKWIESNKIEPNKVWV